jgi:hypothetical protein
MGKKITMFNAQSGVTQEASEDAYRRVYAGEGWELTDDPAPSVDDELEAARAEAASLGLKVHHNAKVETIRKQIDDHKASQDDNGGD